MEFYTAEFDELLHLLNEPQSSWTSSSTFTSVPLDLPWTDLDNFMPVAGLYETATSVVAPPFQIPVPIMSITNNAQTTGATDDNLAALIPNAVFSVDDKPILASIQDPYLTRKVTAARSMHYNLVQLCNTKAHGMFFITVNVYFQYHMYSHRVYFIC